MCLLAPTVFQDDTILTFAEMFSNATRNPCTASMLPDLIFSSKDGLISSVKVCEPSDGSHKHDLIKSIIYPTFPSDEKNPKGLDHFLSVVAGINAAKSMMPTRMLTHDTDTVFHAFNRSLHSSSIKNPYVIFFRTSARHFLKKYIQSLCYSVKISNIVTTAF